jgi:hypothetical protein
VRSLLEDLAVIGTRNLLLLFFPKSRFPVATLLGMTRRLDDFRGSVSKGNSPGGAENDLELKEKETEHASFLGPYEERVGVPFVIPFT